jgi:TATA-box binding protein (TBP) (component of TFIID and TFIIIB)
MNDTRSYIKSLLDIHDDASKTMSPCPSFIRITTITALTKIHCGTDLIDMEKIREAFKKKQIVKRNGVGVFVWSLKENGFYNQATVEYTDVYSKKSIKIFPNCTIHITGCSNINDCNRTVKQLCAIFNKIFGLDNVRCDECRIVMINTNFSINSVLNLSRIISSMKATGAVVTFNPETYSAVKVKFQPEPGMKMITASIFSSGKIIVTGAVNLREIIAAYRFILKTIKTDSGTRMRGTEDIDVFPNFMGFSFDEYWRDEVRDIKSW